MPSPPRIAPPPDLTIPEPGSATARGVLSRAIGLLMAELRAIDPASLQPGPGRDDLAAFVAVVRHAISENPGALASALRRPTVGALVRCLRHETDRDRRAALATELVALATHELAALGALPGPQRISRLPARLVSLAGRLVVDVPAGSRGATFDETRIVIDAPEGALAIDLEAPPGRDRFHPIVGDVVLALADNNPLALTDAHPNKSGNAIDLGDRPIEAWTSALRSAFDLVEAHLPDLRRELELYVQQIVPVGFFDEQHLSASYQEAIGTLYLSLHPSPMTMVEALIHEAQHNKLNALFELDDVLENAFSPLYASPVRPDPRPLHGVLLAVHAFLPVARLYELMIERGHPLAAPAAFRARYEAIRRINREGADVVLGHGRPTPVGAPLLAEIRRWIAHYEAASASS